MNYLVWKILNWTKKSDIQMRTKLDISVEDIRERKNLKL